jgi:hemolysin III
MLSASATYNLGYSSRYRVLFQRCDHAAIFIMIAGTYTPFAISILPALHATALMTFLWLAAIGGIVLRLSSPILFERYAPFVYLILAWSAVPAIGPVIGALHPSALVALVFGGILYSVGVLFFIWERLPFQNAIWHVFVLAAAVCHYIAVLDGIVLMPPGA